MDNLSQTTILSKRRFNPHSFRDACRNLWSSGSYGYFDSQQNGAAVDVSAKIVLFSCFHWNKYDCTWGTKVRRGCWCNMPHICQRLMRYHWAFDLRWVKISGHSEQLGPCGSKLCQQSTLKSQNSGCILYWRFWTNWWSEKIWAGNSPKLGCDGWTIHV